MLYSELIIIFIIFILFIGLCYVFISDLYLERNLTIKDPNQISTIIKLNSYTDKTYPLNFIVKIPHVTPWYGKPCMVSINVTIDKYPTVMYIKWVGSLHEDDLIYYLDGDYY